MTFAQRASAEMSQHKPEVLGWGIRFLVQNERTALLIGYAYRHNKHGYKIEWCPNVDRFSVTIWNAKAKRMGCDV